MGHALPQEVIEPDEENGKYHLENREVQHTAQNIDNAFDYPENLES